MSRPQHKPHELDNLTSEQLEEAANGNDPAGWEEQRQGYVELRDLTAELTDVIEAELTELRQSWSGSGAEAFAAELGKLIDLAAGLRDSAAANADGMREMAVVMNQVRDEVELLRLEDKDWQDNSEGDDAETVSEAREDIRKELRDKLKEADESYQHLAGAYLLPPPEPPKLDDLRAAVEDLGQEDGGERSESLSTPIAAAAAAPEPSVASPATESDSLSLTNSQEPAPTLQNTQPQQGQPAAPPAEPVPTTPPPAEPVPPASAPMMPMGGMGMGGDAPGGSGGGARANGPVFNEARNVPPSRMRSDASRQDLHSQAQHGAPHREDSEEQRQAVHAEDDDSPFVPTDSTVVPPVISGGIPPDGPHDSGPVLTGTVYRHFPEYGKEETPPDIVEEYEDGSSVEIELGAFAPPAPEPVATTEKPSAGDDATARDDAAKAATEDRLLNTKVSGEEYLSIMSELPPDKAVEFAKAQSKLREAETGPAENRH